MDTGIGTVSPYNISRILCLYTVMQAIATFVVLKLVHLEKITSIKLLEHLFEKNLYSNLNSN